MHWMIYYAHLNVPRNTNLADNGRHLDTGGNRVAKLGCVSILQHRQNVDVGCSDLQSLAKKSSAILGLGIIVSEE